MSRITGKAHEARALAWLKLRGLKLVETNYSCRSGEIDLVMLHADTLVFVEVRYRRHDSHGSAAESVNHTKQAKLSLAARHFLMTHPAHADRPCRFDVVALSGAPERPQIDWIEGAFSA